MRPSVSPQVHYTVGFLVAATIAYLFPITDAATLAIVYGIACLVFGALSWMHRRFQARCTFTTVFQDREIACTRPKGHRGRHESMVRIVQPEGER